MSAETEPEFLTYQEVAAKTRISVSAVRQAVARGDMTPSYFGRKPLIRVSEYDRFANSLPAEKQTA
jgi:excisionase family DNA binding protein